MEGNLLSRGVVRTFLTWCKRSSSFSERAGIWSLKICSYFDFKAAKDILSAGRLVRKNHTDMILYNYHSTSHDRTLLSLGAAIFSCKSKFVDMHIRDRVSQGWVRKRGILDDQQMDKGEDSDETACVTISQFIFFLG